MTGDEPSSDVNQTDARHHVMRLAMPGAIAYHYTTPAGLLDILKSQCIHAGSTRHMNDRTEGEVGRAAWEAAGIEKWLPLTEPLRDVEAFVASFSLEEDRLSLWRGYSNGGRGFALGFDCAGLGSPTLTRGRVIYSVDEQRTTMADIEASLRADKESAADKFDAHRLLRRAARQYLWCQAFFKDAAYVEEDEFRIICFAGRGRATDGALEDLIDLDSSETLAFKATERGVVPYVTIPLELPLGHFKKIVIGPQLESDETTLTLELLLARSGLSDVQIVPSSVPYR